MIQGDAPWQARGKAGTSGHELIGFHGGISDIEAGIALALPATHHTNNGDQTDVTHARHVHAADAASSFHSSWGVPSTRISGVGNGLSF